MNDVSFLNGTDEELLLNGTETEDARRDSLYAVIPVTIIYVIIFVTGVVGNIVTCIVIQRNKYMHTATNYYLFSLAISDLLLLVTGLPQEMVSIWVNRPYLFGEAFCVLRGLAAEMSANATVLTITAFTAERYIAICHPFLSHTMSKLNRAIKIIVGIWVVSLVSAAPHAAQLGVVGEGDMANCHVKRIILDHSFELSTILFFALPMAIITVLYALIGLKLRNTSVMKKESMCLYKSNYEPRENSRRAPQLPAQTSRRVVNMLAAVVVAFFICWAPFHAQRLVAIYGINEHNIPKNPVMISIYYVVTYISGIFYYLSATINPILYHIMSLKFREAFKETMGRCCSLQGLQGPGRQRHYSTLGRRPLVGLSQSTDNSNQSQQDDSTTSRTLKHTNSNTRLSTRTKTWSLSDSADDNTRRDSLCSSTPCRPCRTRSRQAEGSDRSYHPPTTGNVTPPKLGQFSVVLRLQKFPRKRRNLSSLFRSRKNQRKTRYYIETAAPYEMSLYGQPVVLTYNRSRGQPDVSISNSSLKDLDRSEMKDELVFYLKALSEEEKV